MFNISFWNSYNCTCHPNEAVKSARKFDCVHHFNSFQVKPSDELWTKPTMINSYCYFRKDASLILIVMQGQFPANWIFHRHLTELKDLFVVRLSVLKTSIWRKRKVKAEFHFEETIFEMFCIYKFVHHWFWVDCLVFPRGDKTKILVVCIKNKNRNHSIN